MVRVSSSYIVRGTPHPPSKDSVGGGIPSCRDRTDHGIGDHVIPSIRSCFVCPHTDVNPRKNVAKEVKSGSSRSPFLPRGSSVHRHHNARR